MMKSKDTEEIKYHQKIPTSIIGAGVAHLKGLLHLNHASHFMMRRNSKLSHDANISVPDANYMTEEERYLFNMDTYCRPRVAKRLDVQKHEGNQGKPRLVRSNTNDTDLTPVIQNYSHFKPISTVAVARAPPAFFPTPKDQDRTDVANRMLSQSTLNLKEHRDCNQINNRERTKLYNRHEMDTRNLPLDRWHNQNSRIEVQQRKHEALNKEHAQCYSRRKALIVKCSTGAFTSSENDWMSYSETALETSLQDRYRGFYQSWQPLECGLFNRKNDSVLLRPSNNCRTERLPSCNYISFAGVKHSSYQKLLVRAWC